MPRLPYDTEPTVLRAPHSGHHCCCLLSSSKMQSCPERCHQLSFSLVIGTLLPPQACGTHAATGTERGCSKQGVPTLALHATIARSPATCTEALSVPWLLVLEDTRICLLELTVFQLIVYPLLKQEKGLLFPFGVMLCYMGTKQDFLGTHILTEISVGFFSFISLFLFLVFVITFISQGSAKRSQGCGVMEKVEAKSWISHTLTISPPPWTHWPGNIFMCPILFSSIVFSNWHNQTSFGAAPRACQPQSGAFESWSEPSLCSR